MAYQPKNNYRKPAAGAAKPAAAKPQGENKSDKVRLTGMFQGKFGFGVRVTDETVDKLKNIKSGDFLDLFVFEESKEGYPEAALMHKPVQS